MKNKVFMAGMFSLALTFGLVLGSCDNTTTVEGDVGINATRPGAPSGVTVTPRTYNTTIVTGYDPTTYAPITSTVTHTVYVITWKAGDNASGYGLYVRQKGRNTVTTLNYNGQMTNIGTYSVPSTGPLFTPGNSASNTDDWTVYVDFTATNPPANLISGVQYEIGVRASGPVNGSSQNAPSSISWATGTYTF